MNRINTHVALVISIQYAFPYSLSYVFIIKVQNIYYGSYCEAFCVLADLIRIDYVCQSVKITARVGGYQNNIKRYFSIEDEGAKTSFNQLCQLTLLYNSEINDRILFKM